MLHNYYFKCPEVTLAVEPSSAERGLHDVFLWKIQLFCKQKMHTRLDTCRREPKTELKIPRREEVTTSVCNMQVCTQTLKEKRQSPFSQNHVIRSPVLFFFCVLAHYFLGPIIWINLNTQMQAFSVFCSQSTHSRGFHLPVHFCKSVPLFIALLLTALQFMSMLRWDLIRSHLQLVILLWVLSELSFGLNLFTQCWQ